MAIVHEVSEGVAMFTIAPELMVGKTDRSRFRFLRL
jgi:hypothetical protein